MKKLFVLIIALCLTGCTVEASQPEPKEATPAAVVVEPEKPAELSDAQIEELKKSCVMIYADNDKGRAQGSGVAIGNNRYLTAYHAVSGNRTSLKISDGQELTIENFDPDIDIMSLVSSDDAIPVKIGDSDNIRIGDEVIIIGSPEGQEDTVIRAIVKNIAGRISTYNIVSSGASGAGVFNEKGELIGILIGINATEYESHIVPINTILEQLEI